MRRCLQRHGISCLPEVKGDKPDRHKVKVYPIGYFHIDIADVRTEEGGLYLFVAIDRTSKLALAELHERATTPVAIGFLSALIRAAHYKLHTVLTDNGIQFADLPKNRSKLTAMWRGHSFDRCRHHHGIEHHLAKPNHAWTNGQVERMNRAIKEATVKRYHNETHDQLRRHLADFVTAYSVARIQFADLSRGRSKPTAMCRGYPAITRAGNRASSIGSQNPNHPGINCHVERMNRAFKEATVQRCHYDTHEQLRRHLIDFITAWNAARRLKPSGGSTPSITSAKYGRTSLAASSSAQPIKCRD